MIKKIVTVCLIVLLSLTVVGVSACKDTHADDMRVINTLLVREYAEVEIDVTTTQDSVVLKAAYDLVKEGNKTNVTYEVDRLNAFGVDGSITAPSEMQTRISGSAVVENKRITFIDGNAINDDEIFNVIEMNMAFRVPYFENVEVRQYSFYAKVIDPKGFMQDETFDGKDMDVKVIYNQAAIASIVINYTASNGATVKLEYAFAR